jgi:hypothetical protein
VYREQYPDVFEVPTAQNKEHMAVFGFPSHITMAMLLHVAARGYEPSILSLANLYLEGHMASSYLATFLDLKILLLATAAIAERADNPDALTLEARLLHMKSAVVNGVGGPFAASISGIPVDLDALLDKALALGDQQRAEGGRFAWRVKCLIEKGWLRLRAGDAKAAMSWFEKAAAESPKSRDVELAILITQSQTPHIAYWMMHAAIYSSPGMSQRLCDEMVKEVRNGGGSLDEDGLAEWAREWKELGAPFDGSRLKRLRKK